MADSTRNDTRVNLLFSLVRGDGRLELINKLAEIRRRV
jgi:hypothetical protein